MSQWSSAWYNESLGYNFSHPKLILNNFTRIVVPANIEVGCSYADCENIAEFKSNEYLVLCLFKSNGTSLSQLSNVLPANTSNTAEVGCGTKGPALKTVKMLSDSEPYLNKTSKCENFTSLLVGSSDEPFPTYTVLVPPASSYAIDADPCNRLQYLALDLECNLTLQSGESTYVSSLHNADAKFRLTNYSGTLKLFDGFKNITLLLPPNESLCSKALTIDDSFEPPENVTKTLERANVTSILPQKCMYLLDYKLNVTLLIPSSATLATLNESEVNCEDYVMPKPDILDAKFRSLSGQCNPVTQMCGKTYVKEVPIALQNLNSGSGFVNVLEGPFRTIPAKCTENVTAFTRSNVTARIMGGNTAQPRKYSFLVSLQSCGGIVCGGTLISPTFVLTAPHCVSSSNVLTDVVIGLHSVQVSVILKATHHE
jgi:hypothetical protein